MILIKNGTLADGERDILIDGEAIKAIDTKIEPPKGTEVIDATGKWVTPGFIDLHVHLREPGFEKKETIASGTKAAIAGGFTAVCCMPNTKPVNDSKEVTTYILEKAREAGQAKVFPLGAVTKNLEDEEMAPLTALYNAGCVGFSNDGRPVKSPALMRRALEWAKDLGLRIHCHEEVESLVNGGVMNESALSLKLGLRGVPAIAEEIMIARDIELARATGGKVHFCHVSTARGVELIRRAKNDGIDVTAEVTPHHLFLTEEAVDGYNTLAKVAPPLRSKEDCEALLAGLVDGTIDVVASDHAPHEADSKLTVMDSAANGLIGLQSTLPLMIQCVKEGKLLRKRLEEVLASVPAKIINQDLGTLAVGKAADICIINPDKTWEYTEETILSKSKNTPFLGRKMQGCVEMVFVNGRKCLSL